jgi:hypothetical protein
MSAFTAQLLVSIEYKETVLEWYPSASTNVIGYDILIAPGTATPTSYTKLNTELVKQTQYSLFLQPGTYWVIVRTWGANQMYSDSDPVIITL